MNSSDSLTFSRLSLADVPNIASLVNREWGQNYGQSGRPVFTEEYLRWAYGGPDQDRNYILGVHYGDDLVGVKSHLSRQVSYGTENLSAVLTTHMTVDSRLPLGVRLGIVQEFSRPQPLDGVFPHEVVDASDISISYYEKNKNILRNTAAYHEKIGIKVQPIEFSQSILDPFALRLFLEQNPNDDCVVKKCSEQDLDALFELFSAAASPDRFSLKMSREAFAHHVFESPQSAVFMCARNDAPDGFVACYALEALKGEKATKVVVVEFLIDGDTPGALAALLQAAAAFGKSVGARGVVIENPTYLNEADCVQVGVRPSARRMVMALRSLDHAIEVPAAFMVDVK